MAFNACDRMVARASGSPHRRCTVSMGQGHERRTVECRIGPDKPEWLVNGNQVSRSTAHAVLTDFQQQLEAQHGTDSDSRTGLAAAD